MSDYYLFDEKGGLTKEAALVYSANTLTLLFDRIRRINIDNTVIALPRLGDAEEDYQHKADSFLNLNSINIDETTIWEVEAAAPITLKLG